jgi:hypothetical protein
MKTNCLATGPSAKELGISSYRVRKLCETGLISDAEFSEGRQWLVPQTEVARMGREGVPPVPRAVDSDVPEPTRARLCV